jgi:chorismate mutase
MTIEETRAKMVYSRHRELVNKVRKTNPIDPKSNEIIADVLDAIIDSLIEKQAVDSMW